VTFATGTPISNTMVEMYTMQRFLDPEGLEAYRRERHVDPAIPLEVLVADPALEAEIRAQIDMANARLANVEQVRAWALVTDAWEPGGDELTPTLKLKRRSIAAKYASKIEELYR